jgi:TPP-dependent indolepyruvate ferredoxin oxidoreductase alpha subunit
VICGILYDGKNDSTPCIGCGECIRTGECVLVKNRQKAKKAAAKYKKEQDAS